eukprot:366390-Chlamydomonas_euryale.AAC.10
MILISSTGGDLTPASLHSGADMANSAMPAPHNTDFFTFSWGSTSTSTKCGRGRPKGSLNKPKHGQAAVQKPKAKTKAKTTA